MSSRGQQNKRGRSAEGRAGSRMNRRKFAAGSKKECEKCESVARFVSYIDASDRRRGAFIALVCGKPTQSTEHLEL